MGAFRDPVIGQILVSSTLLFFLVGSLTGIAVGIGLLARTAATLRVFAIMNRWVSTRRALKPLEVPRDMTPTTGAGARWMGLIILVLAGYALSVLVLGMDTARVASAFRISQSPLAAMALKAARYFLTLGCLFAVVSGILLAFFPRAWNRLEHSANRWYSSRKLITGGDRMHFTLDRLVESFPRASGSVVLVLSVGSAVASALLLSVR